MPREIRTSQDALRLWSALVLARLDAVVEEHGAGPHARAAVLDAVAVLARQRPDLVDHLRRLVDDPALAPAWERHCRQVGLAAGGDVSAELRALLRAASPAATTARTARRGSRCLARARRCLARWHAAPAAAGGRSAAA